MKKSTLALWTSVLVLVVPLALGQVTTGTEPESPDGLSEYTFYWFIGEDAANTTVYLYAKQKTEVVFSGTNDDEVTVEVGPREFASFNAEDLGYGIEEKWFYLEMSSNHPVMTVIDKEIFLRLEEDRYETIHGDRTGARPATELQTEYYMANGDSGSEDDYLVVYAPEETTFTAKRLTNDGEVFQKTVTVNGMFVSPVISIWLGKSSPIYEGYSLIIKSEEPIAANLFEELPWWPNLWTGSGKYLGSFGASQFHNDYLNFDYRPWGWANLYTPDEADLVFMDEVGDEVATMYFPSESSRSTPTTVYRDLGYEVWPQPYLVRIQSDDDFVHGEYTPYETEVERTSAYMGYNTSNSFLELFAFEDAEVTVLDGESGSSVHLSIEKETLYNYTLVDDLGFEPDVPFLASVLSSKEIYQQVRIPIEPRLIPYQSMYLRHYPIRIGPPLKVDFILDPKTLNLDSKGRWVTGYLTFPPGFSPSDVDIETILLQNLLKPEKAIIDGDTLVLKFNRKDLQAILEPGEEVLIEISGNFHSGLAFYGSTTIRVI